MNLIKRIIIYFHSDSLYRNSIYLMLSTFVMAMFGFLFWIINARLFAPDQIGIATTLISISTLISTFSLLGLNAGLIRYLPTSKMKIQKINTSFILVGVTTIVLATSYLLLVNVFSPRLIFVRNNMLFSIGFITITTSISLNSLSETIFIAFRSSKFILFKNFILSIIKLLLPLFLIAFGGYGIYSSFGLATLIAYFFAVSVLIAKFDYVISFVIDKSVTKLMFKYSLGSYISSFVGMLPTMVLPIIVFDELGPKTSAYFYIDLMIANLIYMIPKSVSQSLFAEGGYNKIELKNWILKSVKIICYILGPSILITIFFGKFILLEFGKQYSNEGFTLLNLFAIASIFVALNSIFGSVYQIKDKIKELIIINLVGTISTLAMSFLFINQKLYGIGVAWILSQFVVSLLYCLLLKT